MVAFDWASKSDNTTASGRAEAGWREAAGDFLANFLLSSGLARAALAAGAPIHFVGHSFGTVVISEAVRRLGYHGVAVDQMTTLDPHDQDQYGVADAAVFGNLPDGRPDPRNEPAVRVWDNVTYADNYWQDNEGLRDVPTDGVNPLGPVGHPVEGADNYDLTDRVANTSTLAAPYAPHSRVHEWYFRTVANVAEPGGLGPAPGIDWYPFPNDNPSTTGYATSASVGFVRPPVQPPRASIRANPPPAVFNGDFAMDDEDGNAARGYDHPGYADGGAPLVRNVSAGHGAAANLTRDWSRLTHRPVLIPPGGGPAFLTFEYLVGSLPGGARLEVGTPQQRDAFGSIGLGGSSGWQRSVLQLPASFRGTATSLAFTLVAPWIPDPIPPVGVLVDNIDLRSSGFNLRAGDADVDGAVTFADLVRVAQNYGRSATGWTEGDFDGDGSVAFPDLVILAQNYGLDVAAAGAVLSRGAVAPGVGIVPDQAGASASRSRQDVKSVFAAAQPNARAAGRASTLPKRG